MTSPHRSDVEIGDTVSLGSDHELPGPQSDATPNLGHGKHAGDAGVLLTPAAGTFPSGHAGVARDWDGAAWTSAVTPDPSAPALHAKRSFAAMARRWPFWIAVTAVVGGIGLSVLGHIAQSNIALLVAAAVVGVGGVLLALLLGIARRLRLRDLPATAVRTATLWGIASGLVALGVAALLELGLGAAFRALAPEHQERLSLLSSGPAEETTKLLLPVILIAVGVSVVRSPRLGAWTVAVSGAMFGLVEGIEYLAGGGVQTHSTQSITDSMTSAGITSVDGQAAVQGILIAASRMITEMGHVLWTLPAGVIIVLAWHHRRRWLTGVGVGAWAIAATTHGVNDGVVGLLPGAGLLIGWVVLIIAVYVLWTRLVTRRLVPPDALADVPKAWIPPLPRAAARPADVPATPAA